MKFFFNIPFLKLIFPCFLFLAPFVVCAEVPDNEHVNALLQGQQPLFEENKGQLKDMAGNPMPNLLFRTTLNGGHAYITTKGISYVFSNHKKDKTGDYITEKVEANRTVDWCREDIELVGAVINHSNIQKLYPSEAFSSYYLAHCPQGITDVRMYGKIIVSDIYPGIDWIIYSSHSQGFKYDFYVHPGADPNQIKLHYKGAGDVIVSDTSISVTTRLGSIVEGKLYSYEEDTKKEVKSRYVEKEGVVTFKFGKRDETKSLVIDPPIHVVSWSTCYSGQITPSGGGAIGGVAGPEFIALDVNGNVYATGYVNNSDFPLSDPGGGAYYDPSFNIVGPNSVRTDVFIVKFNNSGVLLWSTYYGGTDDDAGSSLVTDNNGNLFVGGHTFSTNFPLENPGGGAYFQANYAGGGGTQFTDGDAFILKFDNTGAREWATYYGGSDNDANFGLNSLAVTTDIFGNLFVVGGTASNDFPVLSAAGAYNQLAYAGGPSAYGMDMFILKFNNAGVRLWATYFGGADAELAIALACDGVGNLFVTGWTESLDFPKLDPAGGAYFQPVYAGVPAAVGVGFQTGGGGGDAVVMKFANNGALLWSTYYGGPDYDIGTGITTDANGNVFVVGCSGTNKQWGNTSPGDKNFPVYDPSGCAYFQEGNGGATDLFILKFTNTGVRLWATYYGGSDDDGAVGLTRGPSITCDVFGNIFIGGSSGNGCTAAIIGDFPLYAPPGGFLRSNFDGCSEIILMKFSNEGERLWSTYYGGVGFGGPNALDWAEGVAVDNQGNLFVTGETWSPGFPVTNTAGGYVQEHTQSKDNGFFLKFEKECPVVTNAVNTVCQNTGIAEVVPVIAPTACVPYSYLWSTNQTTSVISNLAAGTYTVSVTDILGCDEVAQVTIASFPNPPVVEDYTVTICPGTTTLIHGVSESIPGIYTQTFVAASGCDSISNVTLTLNSVSTHTVQVAACDSYTHNGQVYNASGVYTQTLVNSIGCDSLLTIDLTITSIITTNSIVSICAGQSTMIHGVQQNNAGVYSGTFVAAVGCDSISEVTLLVNPTTTHTINVASCNNYTHNTQVYNTSGIYTQTLVGSLGCDSVLTIDLTINTPVTTNNTVTICQGQTIMVHGTQQNSAGVYSQTFIAVNTCDSTSVVTVNINPVITDTINIIACQGQAIIIHNIPQNAAGIYTQTFTAANGCDSISSVILTYNPTSTHTVTVTACNNYIHNGQVYNATGVYTQILNSAINCDSILTINLTISDALITQETKNICPGQFAEIHSRPEHLAGVYTQTYTTVGGCDSISIVTLNVYPAATAAFQLNPNPGIENAVINCIDQSPGAVSWQWNFGDESNSVSTSQSPSFIYTETGSYQVMLIVENEYGCKDTTINELQVEPEFILYVPNSFTPDGNNNNDEFFPKAVNIDYSQYELYIYDRWGSQIFKSTHPSIGWDGRANNGKNIAQIDTYVWIIRLKDTNGFFHKYTGHVNLLK